MSSLPGRLSTVIEAAINAGTRAVEFTKLSKTPPLPDESAAAHAFPDDDPRSLQVTVSGGIEGTVTIAVGDEFLERILYTSKQDDMVQAMAPVVRAITTELGKLDPIEVSDPVEVEIEEWPGTAPVIVSSQLQDGDETVISFAFALVLLDNSGPKPGRSSSDEDDTLPPISAVSRPRRSASSPVGAGHGLERLAAIEVELSAVLGETTIPLHEVVDWLPGSIVLLRRAAGTPADLRVEDLNVAHGDVVVIDEQFGVRITEMAEGDSTGVIPRCDNNDPAADSLEVSTS